MRIIVETVLLIILSVAIVAMAVVLVIVLSKNKNNNIDDAIYDASKKLNQDTVNSVKLMSDMINQNQVNMAENQKFQLQQIINTETRKIQLKLKGRYYCFITIFRTV